LEFNTPYIFKLSVESTTDPAYYQFKVWKAADPEPVQWNLYGVGAVGGPAAGSLLLVAHWVDATFGQVTVTPLNITTYTLTTNSTGNGSVIRTPDKAAYLQNEAVTLTAIPDNGWVFREWRGDDVPPGSLDATLNLNMTSDKTITAVFEQFPEYSLAVTVTGQGSVSKTPDQISYTEDMTVTLTAIPENGWVFKEWQGDVPPVSTDPTLILTMDGDKTVFARFEQKPSYTLTVNTTGQGRVSKTPDQISYTENMTVTLTATPDDNWLFTGWQGDVPPASESPVLTLTMDGDRVVTALFEQKPPNQYSLSTVVMGQGQVNRTPDQPSYTENMTVTLTATPDDGWFFKTWSGDVPAGGTEAYVTLTMDGDKSVTAIFERRSYIFLPMITNP
jgi:hypothetical protein